ncbi:hypothetical protein TNCV_5137471 [Trichonephila clavipes]|nr:hypothetical protein TNCV_5137471 [Trichonephila clavipes]
MVPSIFDENLFSFLDEFEREPMDLTMPRGHGAQQFFRPTVQRKDKVFFLDINDKQVFVSIDRCKPAFFLNTEDLQLPQTKNETPATVEPNATALTPAIVEHHPTASTPTQPSTRSGRKVNLPTRYR